MLPEAILPSKLGEAQLLAQGNYLLDLRPAFQRSLIRSLSCAHEFDFPTFPASLHKIPGDKNIIVICQIGLTAVGTAIYLRAKGFPRVSFLVGGLAAWKLANPELYKKYSGA